jgi:hypothetical protein
MEQNHIACWLMLFSQILILIGSFLNPPTGPAMIILNIVLPLVMIIYFGLALTGFIKARKNTRA